MMTSVITNSDSWCDDFASLVLTVHCIPICERRRNGAILNFAARGGASFNGWMMRSYSAVMADHEIGAIRALLLARPRTDELSQRRKRLDDLGALYKLPTDVRIESV